MRKLHLLLLSLVSASRLLGACGGEVRADHGSGASAGFGGSAGFLGDGPTEDVDAAPDSDGAPDHGVDADGSVQTCSACSVTEYGCTQQGMESFDWIVSDASEAGCVVTDPWHGVSKELHCEPLEVCSPPTMCLPISTEAEGVLTWTWGQPSAPIKVMCYPKK
ncbi:MAG: hypothetical protein IPM35_35600 [Myxococcales bacterium]|nr:hypothetical protein [Myxococcales bacterium]